MRRPKVHRFDKDTLEQLEQGHVPGVYLTRCGMVGGSELLMLTAVNNGSGHFCSECWPLASTRRQRPVPWQESRWLVQ